MADIQMQATAPFDVLADTYDEVFTRSLIGQAQRAQVWRVLERAFSHGQHVLEINCGTGEDALFLARRGLSVLACDSSPRMIAVAQSRKAIEAPSAAIEFRLLPTEQLNQLSREQFDGAFSNFGGLNCVEDLEQRRRRSRKPAETRSAVDPLPGQPGLRMGNALVRSPR